MSSSFPTLATFMKRSNNETLQYRESRIEGKRLTDIIIRFTRYRSINRFSDRFINRITRAWSPMNNSKIRHTQVSTHVRDNIFSNVEIYIGAFLNSRKRTSAVITWKFIYYIFSWLHDIYHTLSDPQFPGSTLGDHLFRRVYCIIIT